MLKSWKHLKLKPWVESSSSIQPNSWSAVPGNFAQLQGSLSCSPPVFSKCECWQWKDLLMWRAAQAWHHLAYLPLPLKENLLCQVFEINCVLIYKLNKTPCTIKKKKIVIFMFMVVHQVVCGWSKSMVPVRFMWPSHQWGSQPLCHSERITVLTLSSNCHQPGPGPTQ